MRLGKVIAIPDEYSRFGRVIDSTGMGYTIEAGDIPEEVQVGDDIAYKVEIWGGDSGLAYDIKEE